MSIKQNERHGYDMEEKRRHKRLEIDVTVQLERLDEDGITTSTPSVES